MSKSYDEQLKEHQAREKATGIFTNFAPKGRRGFSAQKSRSVKASTRAGVPMSVWLKG